MLFGQTLPDKEGAISNMYSSFLLNHSLSAPPFRATVAILAMIVMIATIAKMDLDPPPLAALSGSAVKVDVGGEVVRLHGSDGSISMSRMESPIYGCAVHMTPGANDPDAVPFFSFRLDENKKGRLLLHS